MRTQTAAFRWRQIPISILSFMPLVIAALPVGAQTVLEPSPEATIGNQGAAVEPQANTSAETSPQAASLARLTHAIEYLASDDLGGRQPGTPEMKLAEEFIIKTFYDAGVSGGADKGTYRQSVPVDGKPRIDATSTTLTFHGPEDQQLSPILSEGFTSLIGRKPNVVRSELVFVGYGIKASEHNYDEYSNVDVQDKMVVMVRREPQQVSDDSVFDGENTSDHSFITRKVRVAKRAGAIGIILVNDAQTAPDSDSDRLVQPNQFGTISFPFYQIKRATLNEILEASPIYNPLGKKITSVEQAEAWIDSRLEPLSQPIKGWTIDAAASFVTQDIETFNLVAVIDGQGSLADETVVVGAHYDHLGMGAYGSRTPWRKEIHNGADDNATGTAAVLELARRFGNKAQNDAGEKPRRRLVLICFTAEEMGLLGALHYTANPLFEIENTVAMVNFDMIGLLRDDRLTIYNWNTSPAFASVLDAANQPFNMELIRPSAGFAGSDHLPFNRSKIPNMFIHTGISDTYHTPDDTFETINCNGVLKVVDFAEIVIEQLLTGAKPAYGKPKRFRLGLQLAREGDENGIKITEVVNGSVAELAGILKGDIVISVDGDAMRKRRDLVRRVRRDAGKTISMKIKRNEQEIDIEIELKE